MRRLVARIVVLATPALAIMITTGLKWGPY